MIVEKLIQLLDRSEHPVLVSKQTKSNWKAGTNRPKLHTVEKIIEENNYDIISCFLIFNQTTTSF